MYRKSKNKNQKLLMYQKRKENQSELMYQFKKLLNVNISHETRKP